MATVDLRVSLIRRVQKEHMFAVAGVKTERQAENWRCRCGLGFTGDGAIERGHDHQAEEILNALDDAAKVA